MILLQITSDSIQRLAASEDPNIQTHLANEISSLLVIDETSSGWLPEDIWNGGEALEHIWFKDFNERTKQSVKKILIGFITDIAQLQGHQQTQVRHTNTQNILHNIRYLASDRLRDLSDDLKQALEKQSLSAPKANQPKEPAL